MNPSQQIRKQAVDAWMMEKRGGLELSSIWIDPLQQLFENLEWSHWDCCTTDLSGKEREERSDIWWAIFKACKAIRTQESGEVTSDFMLAKSVGWAMKPTQVESNTPCQPSPRGRAQTHADTRPVAPKKLQQQCGRAAGDRERACSVVVACGSLLTRARRAARRMR